jgi:hypothetical protein
MGKDVGKAKRWGKRKVRIQWNEEKPVGSRKLPGKRINIDIPLPADIQGEGEKWEKEDRLPSFQEETVKGAYPAGEIGEEEDRLPSSEAAGEDRCLPVTEEIASRPSSPLLKGRGLLAGNPGRPGLTRRNLSDPSPFWRGEDGDRRNWRQTAVPLPGREQRTVIR